MQIRNYISKIMGIVLLLAVFSMHYSVAANHNLAVSKHKDKAHTEVKTLKQDIVIPSYTFDFNVIDIAWQQEFVFGFEQIKPLSTKYNQFFQNSYFEKLFEHHIAINAP